MFNLPVQANDILILASDGLSDNLWDEDVLDEVIRLRRAFLEVEGQVEDGLLRRRTMAGVLSEALCSRARRASERTGHSAVEEVPFARRARECGRRFVGGKNDGRLSFCLSSVPPLNIGVRLDISVIVAVISPVVDIVHNRKF